MKTENNNHYNRDILYCYGHDGAKGFMDILDPWKHSLHLRFILNMLRLLMPNELSWNIV